jgi:DNA-binding NtrC family response regulator
MANQYNALIADDDAGIRQLVVRALKNQEFVCREAEDGFRANELILARKYDVVVTDLRMPHLHGSTLVAALLNLSDRPAIVVITGATQPEEMRKLKKHEIEAIFQKPFDLDAFANEVRSIADRRQALWRRQPLLSR